MTIIGPDIGLIFSLLTAKCIDLALLRDGPLENLWGGGAGEVQKKYSRKGKLNKKKFMQPINPKKNHARNLITKKNSCGSKSHAFSFRTGL